MLRMTMWIFLVAIAPMETSAKKEPVGRVSFVKGEVFIGKNVAKDGQLLFEGDIIETKKGKASVLLGKDSIFHLDQTSKMRISNYGLEKVEVAGNEESQEGGLLDLKFGRTRALIRAKKAKRKNFRIRARGAVMGVRGTVVYIDNPPDLAKPPTFATISGEAELYIPKAGDSASAALAAAGGPRAGGSQSRSSGGQTTGSGGPKASGGGSSSSGSSSASSGSQTGTTSSPSSAGGGGASEGGGEVQTIVMKPNQIVSTGTGEAPDIGAIEVTAVAPETLNEIANDVAAPASEPQTPKQIQDFTESRGQGPPPPPRDIIEEIAENRPRDGTETENPAGGNDSTDDGTFPGDEGGTEQPGGTPDPTETNVNLNITVQFYKE